MAAAPFTETEWMRRLREINSWAAGFDVSTLHHNRAFVAERRIACKDRWKLGHEHWNDWAGEMLALQAEAEASELWDAPISGRGDRGHMNDATKLHLCLGGADFSGIDFTRECPEGLGGTRAASFKYFIFPHTATWSDAVFGSGTALGVRADFSQTKFYESANFHNITFPKTFDMSDSLFFGHADFSRTKFLESATLSDSTFHRGASFPQAEFRAWTSFSNTRFARPAYFRNAQFFGDVSFFHVRFESRCKFEGATFHGEALFRLNHFADEANFSMVQFKGLTHFDGSHFRGNAHFEGRPGRRTRFSGTVGFGRISTHAASRAINQASLIDRLRVAERLREHPWVIFNSGVNFSEVEFEDTVRFDEAHLEGPLVLAAAVPKKTMSFANTQFRRPPDFTGVKFAEPPRLDHMHIDDPLDWQKPRWFSRRIGKLPANERPEIVPIHNDPRVKPGFSRSWPFTRMRVARDENEHARFRKLREMAAAAKDHEQEVRNNAYEIAARRFWVVSPFRRGERGAFWLGWLYQVTSDYGQSLWRPFWLWLGQLILFATLFLTIASSSDPTEPKRSEATACHVSYEGAVQGGKGVYATSRVNEALLLSLRDSLVFDRSDNAKRMYGCLFGGRERNGLFEPNAVPPSITFLSSLQSLISAIFLFLLGLAVRNQFRMR